jgi:hypothetical protein
MPRIVKGDGQRVSLEFHFRSVRRRSGAGKAGTAWAPGPPGEHAFARRCVRPVPGSTGVLVWPPFLHPSYQVPTVLCSNPTFQPLLTSCVTRPAVLPSGLDKPWAGYDSYQISGLDTVYGWTASPVHSSSRPFCVRFNAAVTRHAATLDTGPVASSYPRGVSTRLSTNHFQSARPPPGSAAICPITSSTGLPTRLSGSH